MTMKTKPGYARFIGKYGFEHELRYCYRVFMCQVKYEIEYIRKVCRFFDKIKFKGMEGEYTSVMFEYDKD